LLDGSPLTRLHVRVWLLSAMGIMLDGFDFFIVGVAIPLIKVDLDPTPTQIGLISSSAVIGAIFGAATIGRLADRVGRRLVFKIDLGLFVVFALLSALAPNIGLLILFRFLLGVGIGADYPIAASYVAEIAPARLRSRMLVGAFAFQAVGQIMGVVVGLAILRVYPEPNAWRWMFAFGVVPAVVIVILRRGVPESPKWLASRGLLAEAAEVCSAFLQRTVTSDEMREAVADRGPERPAGPSPYARLFSRELRKRTVLTTVPWFLMDIATYGVGVFTPTIIAAIGISAAASTMPGVTPFIADDIASTKGAAVVDIFLVLGFALALLIINRVYHVSLQIVGFLAMAFGLGLLAYTSALPGGGNDNLVLVFVGFAVFNLFMNMGPNTTTFILPCEVFPTEVRATGHGLAAACGKAGAALGSFVFPIAQSDFGLSKTLAVIGGGCLVAALVTFVCGCTSRVAGRWRRAPEGSARGLQHHQARLGHLVHGVGRSLARVPAVAHAAVGHLVRTPGGDLVDEHAAEVERARRAQRLAQVGGEDPGLQPVPGVVGEAQRLVEVGVGRERDDRTEDLGAAHVHVRRGVDEDGGSQHPVVVERVPGGDGRAFLDGGVDRLADAVGLALVDERADVRRVVEGIADAQRLDERHERAHEGVHHRFVHVHPLHRDAALPGEREAGDADLLGGCLDVRVRLDHDRRVVAELEPDPFVGRLRTDAPAHVGGAGERDEAHVVVGDEVIGDATRGGHHVEPPRRQAALVDQQRRERQRRERRGRRRLQHHGAPGGDRRRHLVGHEVEREVERRDRRHDPDRHAQDEPDLARARRRAARLERDDLTRHRAGGRGGEAERVDSPRHLAARGGDRLGRLLGDRTREALVHLGIRQPLRGTIEDRGARVGLGGAGAVAREGDRDGRIDVGLRPLRHPPDLVPVVGRADDDHLVAVVHEVGTDAHGRELCHAVSSSESSLALALLRRVTGSGGCAARNETIGLTPGGASAKPGGKAPCDPRSAGAPLAGIEWNHRSGRVIGAPVG
jgi:MFS family permease